MFGLGVGNVQGGGRKIRRAPRRGVDAVGGNMFRPPHNHGCAEALRRTATPHFARQGEKIQIGVRKLFGRSGPGDEDGQVVGQGQSIASSQTAGPPLYPDA